MNALAKAAIAGLTGQGCHWRLVRQCESRSTFDTGGRAASGTRYLRLALAALLAACLASPVPAQEAVEEVVQGAVVLDANMIQMSDQQLAAWVFGNEMVFGGDPGRQDPRGQAEKALRLQIDAVDAAAGLSEGQRRKLELAGRGDIHRFLDQFETLKKACPAGPVAQDKWMEVWQKAQPLQARFRAGLHAEGSLFRRTVPSVLDDDQFARYEESQKERDRKRYRAVVQATVAMIDQKLPLTAEQRKRLIDLVLAKTEPPATYGDASYTYHVVLAQMNKIPADDLKPIFQEGEWKPFELIIAQGRFVPLHNRADDLAE